MKTIVNPEAGKLGCLLPITEWNQIKAIKIEGPLNIDDFFFLKGCSNIEYLDISETNSPEIFEPTCASHNNILKHIIIPNNTKEIWDYAFSFFSSIESISIPAGTSRIYGNAFCYCTHLKEINVNSQNPFYVTIDGILYDKAIRTLIVCPEGKEGNIEIPDSVQTIADRAFFGCANISAIKLPDDLKSIGAGAFLQCRNMETLNIPEGVTILDGCVFFGCKKLKNIQIPNKVILLGNQAFYDCNKLNNIQIPASVTVIDHAFCGSNNLEYISIDDKNKTFSDIDGIIYDKEKKSLIQYPCGREGVFTTPRDVKEISSHAFEGAKRITSFVASDWLERIGDYGFHDCAGLNSVYLPTTMRSIGAHAFDSCAYINAFYCNTFSPPVCDETSFLYVNQKEARLYVPEHSVEAYSCAKGWMNFKHIEALK